MFSEGDALLDAIFDNPDDDTPRLVYADWLQEHDQENYAQFIRLQCAAARCKMWSDEANELWVQIGRVWNHMMDQWWPVTVDWWPGIQRLPDSRPTYNLDAVHFRRGFLPPNFPVSVKQVLRYQDCWPWLPTPVSLLDFEWDDDPTALASLPLLRRLRSVRCGGAAWEEVWGEEPHAGSAYLDRFLRSPYLSRVCVLDLSGVALDQSTADVLLTAPNLASIGELEVRFEEGHDCDPKQAILQLSARFKRVIRR